MFGFQTIFAGWMDSTRNLSWAQTSHGVFYEILFRMHLYIYCLYIIVTYLIRLRATKIIIIIIILYWVFTWIGRLGFRRPSLSLPCGWTHFNADGKIQSNHWGNEHEILLTNVWITRLRALHEHLISSSLLFSRSFIMDGSCGGNKNSHRIQNEKY